MMILAPITLFAYFTWQEAHNLQMKYLAQGVKSIVVHELMREQVPWDIIEKEEWEVIWLKDKPLDVPPSGFKTYKEALKERERLIKKGILSVPVEDGQEIPEKLRHENNDRIHWRYIYYGRST